jgi:hypothetical protein
MSLKVQYKTGLVGLMGRATDRKMSIADLTITNSRSLLSMQSMKRRQYQQLNTFTHHKFVGTRSMNLVCDGYRATPAVRNVDEAFFRRIALPWHFAEFRMCEDFLCCELWHVQGR